MYIYWILLFGVLISYYFIDNKKHYIRLSYAILWALVLVAISALRADRIGGDLFHYIPLFEDVCNSNVNEILTHPDKYGYFFKLYLLAFSKLGDDSFFFKLSTALISIPIPIFFFYKYSKSLGLSLFIYIGLGFYTNTFNSVRSSIALAMGMVGVHYLIKHNNLKAVCFFLIGIEVHKTLMPILALFIIRNVKLNYTRITVSIASSIAISVIFRVLISKIVLLYEEGYESLLTDATGHGYSRLLLYILITYGCYFVMRKNRATKYMDFFLVIMCFAACLQTLAPIISIATRVSYFFAVYQCVLLPNVLSEVSPLFKRRLMKCSLIAFTIFMFKMDIMTPRFGNGNFLKGTNSQATIPYSFFWESKGRDRLKPSDFK